MHQTNRTTSRQRNRNATLPTKKFQWKTQEWENRARNGSMRLTDTHFSPPHPPTVPHPAHHNHHPTPPHPPNVPHPAHHPMPHQPTTCPSEPKSRSWLHWRCDHLQTYNNLFLTRPLYNTGPRTSTLHQPPTLHSAPPLAQYALHMQKNLRVRAACFPCGTITSMQNPHLNLATTPPLLTSTSIQPPLRK